MSKVTQTMKVAKKLIGVLDTSNNSIRSNDLAESVYTLSKFEKVRVIGTRATQISLGAPPLVDITGMTDSLAIAEKELLERKIPLKVKRTFPDGKEVFISISEMSYR